MAKGSILKQEITNKILETFPGSFLYNNGKEIRICGNENGELLQVKVTLTCAKENVEVGNDNDNNVTIAANNVVDSNTTVEPTQEEKDNVRRLMEALNL